MKYLRSLSLVLPLGLVLATSCNAILDNQQGVLTVEDGGSEPDSPDATVDAATIDAGSNDAESSDDASDDDAAPVSCAPDEKSCGGRCVGRDDPNFGCRSAACTPCAVANGSATCKSGACAVEACDPGHADCNGRPDDGCEADLTRAATCGTCTTKCPDSAPVCVPSNASNGKGKASYRCDTGCKDDQPLLCKGTCTNPQTDVHHCGGCDVDCPTDPLGTTTCARGACRTTCNDGAHRCGDRCVADTDATACGLLCLHCAPPANAAPACASGSCGYTCNAGFADCDHLALNGCETVLTTDPRNCGACGVSCDGGTCSNGTCAPAPTPDAGILPLLPL